MPVGAGVKASGSGDAHFAENCHIRQVEGEDIVCGCLVDRQSGRGCLATRLGWIASIRFRSLARLLSRLRPGEGYIPATLAAMLSSALQPSHNSSSSRITLASPASHVCLLVHRVPPPPHCLRTLPPPGHTRARHRGTAPSAVSRTHPLGSRQRVHRRDLLQRDR